MSYDRWRLMTPEEDREHTHGRQHGEPEPVLYVVWRDAVGLVLDEVRARDKRDADLTMLQWLKVRDRCQAKGEITPGDTITIEERDA